MSSLKTAFSGYVRYKGRAGHWAFLLHRITGLGTLLFLTIHIVDTSFVYFAPQLYEHAIALYHNPLFMAGEILLVFSLIYHGVNGLRITIFDLWKPEWWEIHDERKSVLLTLIVAIVLWLPAAAIMGYKLLKYGFGFFGG
jgi:succinate dehydrogenase / fumarate reductase cytochrome b subunit